MNAVGLNRGHIFDSQFVVLDLKSNQAPIAVLNLGSCAISVDFLVCARGIVVLLQVVCSHDKVGREGRTKLHAAWREIKLQRLERRYWLNLVRHGERTMACYLW